MIFRIKVNKKDHIFYVLRKLVFRKSKFLRKIIFLDKFLSKNLKNLRKMKEICHKKRKTAKINSREMPLFQFFFDSEN